MTTLDTAKPKGRVIPTLETLSDSQIAAIRKIPPHDAAVPPTIEATRPAGIFTDESRYAEEQAHVFRRLPVPVIPSQMLAEPGSVLAHDGYGVPLLLTRDKAGVVRAFLNACQHKGSKLIEGCVAQKASKVICPYHAWMYALDGRLAGVPREETFENLDKSKRGLAELPCTEAGGIVWVKLDKTGDADFSSLSDQIAADFEKMGIDSAHVYGRQEFDLKSNWKLVLEPFLEGYHVQRLHAKSIGDMFADSPNIVDRFGPHIRQISGKMNYTPEALDEVGENIHKTVTHAYLLFPNTVVVTSPYYISVMILMPRAAGRTRVDYYMLTPGPADGPKAEEVFARSYELILKVFGTEDFKAAELCHEGLSSGALDEVVYSGLEDIIPAYYDSLDRHL